MQSVTGQSYSCTGCAGEIVQALEVVQITYYYYCGSNKVSNFPPHPLSVGSMLL